VKLIFKALQTYSTGEVVRWIEVAPEGGARPEHPAPVVTVQAPAVAADPSPVPPTDGAARWLAGGGLLTGLLGLAVALAALRRRRPAGVAPSHEDGAAPTTRTEPSSLDKVAEPAPVGASNNGSVRR
jgi:hypothetical protein